MVKALLLPKPIEAQCVKRILQSQDSGVIQSMLQPTNVSNICVVVCQDGRGLWADPGYAGNFKLHLEKLYKAWGRQDVSVELSYFSFRSSDVTQMMQLLVDADIFVMSGVFVVDDAWRQRTLPGSEAWPLVERLQERV